jgi:hypothetical protein
MAGHDSVGPVSQRAVFPPRARSERATAWVVTGPVGHLLAFLADVAVAWLAWARGALGRRVRARRSAGLGDSPQADGRRDRRDATAAQLSKR